MGRRMDACMSKGPAHCQDPLEAEDDLTLVHATRKAVL
jgi:hypothetical protein